MSPPALAAAYGEFGDSGVCSSQEPLSMLPYTSSVEMWTILGVPASRHACIRVWVPSTLVRTNSPAPTMERSTWDSAAKLTTRSCPGTTSASSSASQMSPLTNVKRPSTGARLARLPA